MNKYIRMTESSTNRSIDNFKSELSTLLKKYNAVISATAGNGYMDMWISSSVGQINVNGHCTIHKSHVVGLNGDSDCLKITPTN